LLRNWSRQPFQPCNGTLAGFPQPALAEFGWRKLSTYGIPSTAVNGRRFQSGVAGGFTETMANSPRVLIVDDDMAIRMAFQIALQEEGYEVALAEHGKAALTRILQFPPEVILLDLRMPIMDGPTFAQEYHHQPGPHAPIVVITAMSDGDAAVKEMGAAACLSKPFSIDEVVSTIEKVR
jgi:CheY-like chemotaxis protein